MSSGAEKAIDLESTTTTTTAAAAATASSAVDAPSAATPLSTETANVAAVTDAVNALNVNGVATTPDASKAKAVEETTAVDAKTTTTEATKTADEPKSVVDANTTADASAAADVTKTIGGNTNTEAAKIADANLNTDATTTTAANTTAAAAATTSTDTAKPSGAADAADASKATKKEAAPTPTPLQQLYAAAKSHSHDEIWGIKLSDPDSHIPSQIVFQKYLNANDGDIAKAKDQLIKTLNWRQEHKPLELPAATFSKDKFAGLGYVTVYGDTSASAKPEDKEVFTWNVYGIVKDLDKTFGDLKEFIRWRIALMELGIASLNIGSATSPITETEDPYKIYQVHDYKSVAFFRQSAQVKSASTETIKVFAQNYPELLKEKFFVNVPAIMGFIYGLMKLFVAPKTIKKFHPMSNGAALAAEFGDSKLKGLGEKIPSEYGGKGETLDAQGKTVTLA